MSHASHGAAGPLAGFIRSIENYHGPLVKELQASGYQFLRLRSDGPLLSASFGRLLTTSYATIDLYAEGFVQAELVAIHRRHAKHQRAATQRKTFEDVSAAMPWIDRAAKLLASRSSRSAGLSRVVRT